MKLRRLGRIFICTGFETKAIELTVLLKKLDPSIKYSWTKLYKNNFKTKHHIVYLVTR